MKRLDQIMVERGLCESRERAKRLVLAGQVRINSQIARKASDWVKPEDQVQLDGGEKYVSRGGHKLEHALHSFGLDATGCIAVDLGASTGGFTDCLLQHGAAMVYAVDVGHGQLAWKLRQDPRVVVMERVNARHLTPSLFPRTPDFAVIDCSFISLKMILPTAISILTQKARLVALIKPQFEAGKAEADRGRGVITDSAIHQRVVQELKQFVGSQAGVCWRDVIESPLLGPAGNKEFLVTIEKES